MPALTDTMARYVSLLRAAGIAATDDVRLANPPCVIVLPPKLTARNRGWDMDFEGLAVVPNVGTAPALTLLGQLIDQVQAALVGAVTTGERVDVPLSDGGPPVPGYRLTWSTSVC